MFDINWLKFEDYEQLVEWWKQWKWSPPTREMLPDNAKGGIMVSKNGINICAGFIYNTNSSIAWCEYIVSNQEYREKDRKEALQELINAITEIARAGGFNVVFTSTNNVHLLKRLDECGYVVGDTGVTQLIKKL